MSTTSPMLGPFEPERNPRNPGSPSPSQAQRSPLNDSWVLVRDQINFGAPAQKLVDSGSQSKDPSDSGSLKDPRNSGPHWEEDPEDPLAPLTPSLPIQIVRTRSKFGSKKSSLGPKARLYLKKSRRLLSALMVAAVLVCVLLISAALVANHVAYASRRGGRHFAAKNGTIDQLRSRQLASCRRTADLCDSADVHFIARNDSLLRLALESRKNVDKAANFLDEIMRWRKEFGVSKLAVAEFPCEVFEVGASAIVGTDRDGDPVFWLRVKYNIPLGGNFDKLGKRLTVFVHELMLHRGSGRFTIVNDFSDAGWNNFEVSKSQFLAQVIAKYYPGQVKVALFLNLPWYLQPILSIVSPLMPADLHYKVVSLDDLLEYIDIDQVPKYAAGNNPIDFTKPPQGCYSWHKKLPDYLTSDDMKKFMAATASLRKESKRWASN